MICALDSNLLANAAGLNDEAKQRRAKELLETLAGRARLPAQVLAETYNLLLHKARLPRAAARAETLRWSVQFPCIEVSDAVIFDALELAADHHLSIWDALVVAAAAAGECALVLSEDLQHGFRWRGVTVVNPFAFPQHPLLKVLLASS